MKITANIILLTFVFLLGCTKHDPDPIVSVNDFVASISENPAMGQSVGTVIGTVENATNKAYYFTPEHTGIAEHLSINRSTGEITVKNPSFFDYEQTQSISGTGVFEARNNSDKAATAIFNVFIQIIDLDETIAPSVSVQQRLDGGESPIQIYNSDNTLLDSLYGKNYAGGLIFYLNTATGNGMVASLSTFSALAWDFNTSNLSATNATSTSVGSGSANTNTIVQVLGTGGTYPARVCSELNNGGSGDWFLPAIDELELMYDNLHAKGYGSFQNQKYWSSSEISANSAWTRDFGVSSGQTSVTVTKTVVHLFRPVRTF